MLKLMRRAALVAAGFLLLLLVAPGCSGRKSVVPVTGEVKTKGGQPAGGAVLVFHTANTPLPTTGTPPTATVRDDGTFTPTTYVADDGLPEGEYVVTVYWPEKSTAKGGGMIGAGEGQGGADRLKGRYADRTKSTLKASVKSGQDNKLSFQLD